MKMNEYFDEPPRIGIPESKINKDPETYRFGNFDKYYVSRLRGFDQDPRLQVLKKLWFQNRHVLDIGCNSGILTLSIAQDFEPKLIRGIDIDGHLIGIAQDKLAKLKEHLHTKISGNFPYNVSFNEENYVFDNENELNLVTPEFDTILAFSVTKWIQLNWGDRGLMLFFKRVYKNLKDKGCFILEAQPISQYEKYKSPDYVTGLETEIGLENFKNIKLFPEQFKDYLLSKEVGFSTVEEIGIPEINSEDFHRKIQVFYKAT